MPHFADRFCEAVRQKGNPLCVGLDPRWESLPDEIRQRHGDDSLEAIEEILGALLDISRLDAGAMKPSITSFRIGDLMRSLEIEFAPIARAKGLKLTFVPSSLPV